jgi:hypothetical protein
LTKAAVSAGSAMQVYALQPAVPFKLQPAAPVKGMATRVALKITASSIGTGVVMMAVQAGGHHGDFLGA